MAIIVIAIAATASVVSAICNLALTVFLLRLSDDRNRCRKNSTYSDHLYYRDRNGEIVKLGDQQSGD